MHDLGPHAPAALEVEGRLRIKVGSGIYVNAPPGSEPEAPAGTIEGPLEVLRARAFVESAVAEDNVQIRSYAKSNL